MTERGPGAGMVGLHSAAARLDEAGYAPSITREDLGAFLTVTDPDGCQIQVHEPAPQRGPEE